MTVLAGPLRPLVGRFAPLLAGCDRRCDDDAETDTGNAFKGHVWHSFQAVRHNQATSDGLRKSESQPALPEKAAI